MSRRNTSVFEGLIDISSRLPWWLSLTLALVSYLGLHWYAIKAIPPASAGSAQIYDSVGQAILRGIATGGQYILSLAFAVGAGISAWKRWERRRLVSHAREDTTASTLGNMTWREFELVVGEAFRQRGYQVTERGGNGPDGGVDLVIRKGSESTVVQCKQYRAPLVGVAVVRELFGAMAAEGASAAMVVSLGKFSRDAQAFAEGRNIQLVTGADLTTLMREGEHAQSARAIAVDGAALDRHVRRSAALVASDQAASDKGIQCPRCNAPMVKRRAKTCANAGKEFWGCTRFPDCRGSR